MLFRSQQEIEIGPMSGESNVVYWLRRHNFAPEPELVKEIMGLAKNASHLLSNEELLAVAKAPRSRAG